MTMPMKRKWMSVIAGAAALLLSACGVQIQMTTLKPAEIDLGRGAPLTVQDCSRNSESSQLAQAFRQQIANDGFYAQYDGSTQLELHNVSVENVSSSGHSPRQDGRGKKSKKEHRPTPGLHGVVVVMNGGKQIYRRDYTQSVYAGTDGRPDMAVACAEFAAEIMDDLTPVKEVYYEYIEPDDTNPALEQAAKACSVGNWSIGKELVKNALRQNPNCAEAYYLLGLIARNDRDFQTSDNYFYRANALNSQSKYTDALRDNARMQQDEVRAGWQMNN